MFTIEPATLNDIPDIMSLIEISLPLLPDPDWFVSDTEEFFARHIEEEGFTLKAVSEEDGRMAAFLTIRIPGLAEDNCGYSLSYPENDLLRVAHMDTCVVHPDYRGNRLESRLIAEAEKRLKESGHTILLGTVHPDNVASVKSFLKNGFHIEKTLKKYGGKLRHIMGKKI